MGRHRLGHRKAVVSGEEDYWWPVLTLIAGIFVVGIIIIIATVDICPPCDCPETINKGSVPPPPATVEGYYQIDENGDTVGDEEIRILGSRKHPFHFNKDTIEVTGEE